MKPSYLIYQLIFGEVQLFERSAQKPRYLRASFLSSLSNITIFLTSFLMFDISIVAGIKLP